VTGPDDPSDRVRTLLLRGDNQLKHGRVDAARATFAEALAIEELAPDVRALIERRIASLAEIA
jgi:predicted negative regulator of RcsB-dependent stress response